MAKKVVPFSKEAEEGVIGSILVGGEKVAKEVAENISPAFFHLPENRPIAEAIEFLVAENKPIDLVTVREYLDDRNTLESVWGQARLIALSEGVFTVHNASQYAKTIKNKYILRSAIKASNMIESLAIDEELPISDVIDSIGEITKKLTGLHSSSFISTIDKDIELYQEAIEKWQGKEIFDWSWWSRFKWLDENTDGIQRKKTYRIGAKSNVGKTTFIYNVICSLLTQKAKVMFFTLENEKETTINYLLSCLQGVNSRHLKNGTTKADIDLLFPYRDNLVIVDDDNSLSGIFKKIEKYKPDVVFLDYIGLVEIKGQTEESKYASYAAKVPQFVKDNNISWIDLSNLSINADDESIKESGQFFWASQLKNNLDVGIHITYHKPFYEYREGEKDILTEQQLKMLHNKQVLDMKITKNRLWPVGVEKAYMTEYDKGGRFREVTQEDKNSWF